MTTKSDPTRASLTPRTDDACHGFCQANPQKTDLDMWGIQCVDADFARMLERENVRIQETHRALMAEADRRVEGAEAALASERERTLELDEIVSAAIQALKCVIWPNAAGGSWWNSEYSYDLIKGLERKQAALKTPTGDTDG